MAKAKNGKSSNSERVEPCYKGLTKQFEEDLFGYILEPGRLDQLTISQLKALLDKAHKKRTLSNSMKSSSYQPSQKPYKQKDETFKDDLTNIGPKIEFVIDKKLRKKEWQLSLVLSAAHILAITWIFISQKDSIISWYLVLGTTGFWVLSKWLHRAVAGRELKGIAMMPKPHGIILIPLTSLFVLIANVYNPGLIGLKQKSFARILSTTTLKVSCDSGINIGTPLSERDIVFVESLPNNNQSCARVTTSDGRVGFISKNKITLLQKNTFNQFRYKALMITVIAIFFIMLSKMIYWLYLTKILPIVLGRNAEKQARLLRKQIEGMKLIEGFSINENLEIGLDLQEAKSQLAIKIAKRHHEQAKKIILSDSFTPKEKGEMIENLTQCAIEALGQK